MTTTAQTTKTLQDGDRFGEFGRYKLLDLGDKRGIGAPRYAVADAERMDEITGGPAIIRQGWTIEETIKGL